MLKIKLIILFFFSTFYGYSQIEVVPIQRYTGKATTKSTARTTALSAMPLPFWDDFSFNIKNEVPNDTLWQTDSKSVWVNNGTGINPPSIYVAAFDGYDSTGKPYSTEILARGFADVMTSRPLKMADVAEANRNAVFMSFFFQFAGNGDKPEQGDALSLLFKNRDNQWIEVWSQTNDGTLDDTKFIEVSPINIRSKERAPDDFFHNDFQFQFRSFGRLSGPYDVWNLDYVYVSNGKSQYAPIYLDFPDRTVRSPLSSFLKDYWSIPLKHYLTDETSNTIKPSTNVTNRRLDQKKAGQPVDYSSIAEIYSKINAASVSIILATDADIDSALRYNSNYKITLDKTPSLSGYNENDSLYIKLQFTLRSNDMIRKPEEKGPNGVPIFGDYDTIVYKGINFKHNDVVTSESILSNYYAYDDGKAENGIKLNGKGTQLAYEFTLKTTTRESIVAIDMYFPNYGDDTNQFIQLFIADTLPANDNEYLLKQAYAVQRTTHNKFVRYKIPGAAAVKDKFYIGWQINSEAVIPVGLDRNSDTGSKIYSKTFGAENWVQNTKVYGSIMMRPVFGTPEKVTSGVEPSATVKPYPNPNSGNFYLPLRAELIQLFDLSGKAMEFTEANQVDKKQITILNPATGLYFVRYFDQKWVTEKVLVRP
ncbi:MAG: T9SS type A sorting domain-containing protein [Cyclobacteriaceae bacterium]|nr:T9SS type A sorting domain-containing protein [Cyclobacteriaceae bacterium]